MRDREAIDSELRLIAERRQSIRERGGQPSWRQVDELLDERLGHLVQSPHAFETAAVGARETQVVADTRSQPDETNDITLYRRKAMLRRFGPVVALPLSLLAIAGVLLVMFGLHKPQPAQPAADPPPSGVRPSTAAPEAPAPQLDVVDRAFIAVLKQDGVPVPSHEYVTTHGHAVCDFLMHHPNFADAVRFVQGSSIWDADQSANFTAGAVVSYCPQAESASADEMQPGFQNALSGMRRIQGDLQRIQGDLQGIQGDLPAISGR